MAQRELLGRFDASAASTAGGASGGELRARDRLEAQPGRAAWIKLKDGTVLWLGGGGVLEARDARRLELREGRVLIQVAKGPTAFRVDLADGTHVEALGTRFEVELAAGGPRVRVVEGRVRRSGEGKSADARGGQEIGSDFAVRAFDPREVLAPWLDAARPDPDAALGALPSAPWPQLGGSPGHTGVTPVRGPAALVAEAFYPFPRVEGGGEAPQYAPAVVDARERVFVLRRADAERSQLWVLDLRAGERAWKPCGEPVLGLSQNPPVVTPRGLVALGVSIMTGPNVVAWDPGLGRVAWTKDVGSSVYALTAAHDGAVICSTFQRVVALDELDGQERWSFAHESVSEVQAPACVLENGEVVIASRAGRLVRLAPDGKLMKDAGWNSQQGLFWPPVARGDGSAWIACPLGDVGCWKADGAADVLLSGAQASTWPLGNDVLALGPALQLGRGVKAELAGSSPVQALALDGRGFLYVGAHATLSRYRYDAKAFAAGRPPATDALSPVQQGEIVRGGIAILPDRLVVTTTEGVQLFK
ncbi:MAG: PQQ-binding-like beta-propeller repeat protein [Planctomycetota bacterium]|nr:PQQ-binding-like beta-propeller repeat protein [Planctomycetota bacterium]